MSFLHVESPPADIAPGPGPILSAAGVVYRIWAPDHREISIRIQRAGAGPVSVHAMEPRDDGYFVIEDRTGRAGDRYQFVFPDGSVRPDPATRFQPEGVHGPSQVVDPTRYPWRCESWQRPAWTGQPIYELHVGTFTTEGTFLAAIDKLDHVASLGVGAIELMPLADFPGGRNWGYDGVCLFAPARCYGHPDDLRALIDAAHERGLAVILDAVYNHLGPDGNYLGAFASEYFDPHRHTPWGQAFNLSGPFSAPVRDFFLSNAAYWFDAFRFDGLRLDATHTILDPSPKHLLREIADLAHARGAFVIAEDERNSAQLLSCSTPDGCGIDALWSDDFHHQVRVALTGVQEGYFQCYAGSTADLATTLRKGWFYTGQPYFQWKGRPRGEPSDSLPPPAFVYCIENHDQVGNRALGERLAHLVSPAAYRAASALLCLTPYAPMIFMGQEWAAATPFLFFTDFHGELGRAVSEGRRREFAHAGINQSLAPEDVPDPQDERTFAKSKLNWDESAGAAHAAVLQLYQRCLRERAAWLKGAALERGNWSVCALEGAVAIRYRPPGQPERLVIASLAGYTRVSLPENSELKPPPDSHWSVVIDSDPENGVRPAEGGVASVLVFREPATVLLTAAPGSPQEADV